MTATIQAVGSGRNIFRLSSKLAADSRRIVKVGITGKVSHAICRYETGWWRVTRSWRESNIDVRGTCDGILDS